MISQTVMRILCAAVGYGFGNYLTAETVTRRMTGKSVFQLGRTGNPGMANVMENLGLIPGLKVLAGDILKTGLAFFLCRTFTAPVLGGLGGLYAGCGCVLGHDFPVTKKFRGGKGVTCTCATEVFYAPFFGIISCLCGAVTVLASKYLCLGAPVIPGLFTVFMFITGKTEEGILSAVLTLLMLNRHFSAIHGISTGTCPKTDILGRFISR